MLHPKKNRIDYGEQIIPPEGYKLAQAIGTTYSLDLEILMVLPVALFYSQNLEGSTSELRYDILDAITNASEKITIFYQNGQLKSPNNYHHLMAYWEKGIQGITMPDYVSSFHPKIWIIRFDCKNKPSVYRLLVTSRNLSNSRDWDVAFSTEGIVSKTDHAENRPLVHFIQFLNKQSKRKVNSSFLKDLIKVQFELPVNFESLSFHPIGIPINEAQGKYLNPITKTDSPWEELLIMSPFLDEPTLKKLSRIKKSSILSRREELDTISESTLYNFKSYQFSKFIVEAEFLQELEEENIQPLFQDLHAKLFIGTHNKIPYWFIGSANCTDPAQGRNIEFMIELKTNCNYKLKPSTVLKSLTENELDNNIVLFEPYEIESRENIAIQNGDEQELRKTKYLISRLPINGSIELQKNELVYNLTIEIDTQKIKFPPGYTIKLKPLPEIMKTPVILEMDTLNLITKYTGYSEIELSPFLEFQIEKDDITYSTFLLQMQIELPETRFNKILTSIINSRSKFLKYLTFLLSGEEVDLIEHNGPYLKGSTGSNNKLFFADTPLYEKLLVTASRNPERLKMVDSMIERIKSETDQMEEPIISPEFESFWQVFKSFF